MYCVYCYICIIGTTHKSSRKTGNPETLLSGDKEVPGETADQRAPPPILRELSPASSAPTAKFRNAQVTRASR
jgi:hypothetical protein